MDIQKMLDAICESNARERANFMASLGDLYDACKSNPNGLVIVNGSSGLGAEDSYRGYYNELAFALAGEPTPVSDVLAACDRALTEEYYGYKGGDYRYNRDTSIWYANYGCTGQAIVNIGSSDGNVVITTKDYD